MDVLGVKASYLNLSGTPGGIVEKIWRQHGSVWLGIFDSYSNAHFSTSHTGKTHCFANDEKHMHTSQLCEHRKTWKQNARPAAHFNNTIYRQYCLNSPTLYLRTAYSYLIPNGRQCKETRRRNNRHRVFLHCRSRYIINWCPCWGQSGLKWPGKAGYWPAFEDVLRTLNP